MLGQALPLKRVGAVTMPLLRLKIAEATGHKASVFCASRSAQSQRKAFNALKDMFHLKEKITNRSVKLDYF
ncbi:MAG: hypothetical protein O9353_09805 [Bacteroidia bacterium]|nr:hypothetical protein [Bacteroidia bacterium]